MSICVASQIMPMSAWLRSNWAIPKICSLVPSLIKAMSLALEMSVNFSIYRWSTPISSDRTAFRRLSSIVRPMLMTSPVAFICVPSLFCAEVNLSNGKRGIFVTT